MYLNSVYSSWRPGSPAKSAGRLIFASQGAGSEARPDSWNRPCFMLSCGFHRTAEEGLSAKNDEEANHPVSGRNTGACTCRSSAHQSEEPHRGVAIHCTSGALTPASGCIESPQGASGGFLLSESQVRCQRFRNQVGKHVQKVVEAWRCQHCGRKGRFVMSVSGRREARIKELGTPRHRLVPEGGLELKRPSSLRRGGSW